VSNVPQKQKGRKAAKYRSAKCLNCGHPLDLSDIYCSYCGQLNSKKQLSLNDFFGEFISSILTYDSRLRYTIKDILFKPGTISRNYVEGQRLKYANPFRFYLSVSIIYFIIQSLIGSITGSNNIVNFDGNNSNNKNTPENILSLNNKDYRIFKNDTLNFNQDTLFIGKDTLLLKSKPAIDFPIISEAELDTMDFGNKISSRFELYYDFYETTEIKDASVAIDSLKHNNTYFNKWLYSRNQAIERIKENPYGFANYLLNKVPFFLFFFAPIFALFFWLIYSKKKYTYMEHLVFLFHIFGFVFLAMLIALIPDTIFGLDIFSSILFLLIGPFYFYKALRNFYKQNRFVTIIKYVFLNFIFTVSISIVAAIFFFVTAAAY